RPAAILRRLNDVIATCISPESADAACWDLGLFGLVVRESGRAVGYAIARSHPQTVIVAKLQGRSDACRLLLNRLVRGAGERDISVWCAAERPRLARLLARMGFRRMYETRFAKRPSILFRLDQN